MTPRERKTGGWRRGFLGYYALSVIEREPIYAYQLARMIAERTQGTWHPSPGALYPALRSLSQRGLIRAMPGTEPRTYRITPAGRRRLVEIRRERRRWGERAGNAWRLALDVVAPEERAELGLRRLRTALELVETLGLGTDLPVPPADRRRLRTEVLRELEGARRRWTRNAGPPPARTTSPGST